MTGGRGRLAPSPDEISYLDLDPSWSVTRTLRVSKGPVLTGPGVEDQAGDTAAWWSTRTPDGPGTMCLILGGTRPRAEFWGPGSSWLGQHLPSLLGEIDRSAGSFRPPPQLRAQWAANPFRLGATRRPWDSAVGAVLGQKVQTTKASRSRRALARRFGERAPGPRQAWVLPSAETVAEMGYHQFHQLGVERTRATRLIRVAREFSRVDTTDEAATLTRLRSVAGVGPWTTALIAATAYGNPDAVPVGDAHLPNTVSWHLAGEPRGDDDRMLELLEPFAGHRWRVILLAKSAGRAPAYGPRLSLVSDGLTRGK